MGYARVDQGKDFSVGLAVGEKEGGRDDVREQEVSGFVPGGVDGDCQGMRGERWEGEGVRESMVDAKGEDLVAKFAGEGGESFWGQWRGGGVGWWRRR